MCESAERMRRMIKQLKENDEPYYQELKEKERKQQKITRDQKKAERVQDSVKLKQYREYERKRKAGQRKKKKIAEQDGVEQDGRKASGKRTRRANLVKKNNQIQSLTVKVAKLTNHNRRLSRKVKKKDITPSSPILSSTVIETPQASTSNSEVESPKASAKNNGIASPKTMVLTLWDSLSSPMQKRTTWKMILSSSRSLMRKGM